MSTYGPYTSWDADNTFDGQTARYIIPAASISTTGAMLRLTFGFRVANWTFSKVYIGHKAAAGDAYDFDSAPTAVLFSGVAGGTVTAGGLQSDATTFALDETKDLIVAIYHASSTDVPRDDGSTGYALYYKAGDDAATQDATGYSTSGYSGNAHYVQQIDIVTADITTYPPATAFTWTAYGPYGSLANVPVTAFAWTSYAPSQKVTIAIPVTAFAWTSYAPTQSANLSIPLTQFVWITHQPTTSGQRSNRYRVPVLAFGKHLALKFQGNTAADGFRLIDCMLNMPESRPTTPTPINARGTHIGLKFAGTAAGGFSLESINLNIGPQENR